VCRGDGGCLLQEYEPGLLKEVQNASRDDMDWLAREAMLKDLITSEKELPINWQYKDGFSYLKNGYTYL